MNPFRLIAGHRHPLLQKRLPAALTFERSGQDKWHNLVTFQEIMKTLFRLFGPVLEFIASREASCSPAFALYCRN